ncbi:Beta-N-acetylhexosaminidase [Hexamita inflata]|uniref:beta-N-acetylhexosaminidase n=1 Tax=Hexamita inflata TaxID=28002 RepID=A0AA86P8X9_9EUKA|nr:Beta-N-acetylhexosaminidase [Hexamita inflata]
MLQTNKLQTDENLVDTYVQKKNKCTKQTIWFTAICSLVSVFAIIVILCCTLMKKQSSNIIPQDLTANIAYAHRGFMLDTSRKFFPVSTILALLDMMAANKLNVFHWHFSDSQSFSIQWSYNSTSINGADYYSLADVSQVIAKAASLNIEVIPEFEMPGHSDIFGIKFPSIISGIPDVNNPQAEMNLKSPDLKPMITTLLKDFLSAAKPFNASKRVHLGADEVAMIWPDTNPKATYTSFENSYLLPKVKSFGKTAIVWNDPITSQSLALSKEFTIQVWTGKSELSSVLSKGYKAIVSTSQEWYIGNATPEKIANYVLNSSLIIGAEVVWFTSPGDDPVDISWLEPVIVAAGKKLNGL